MRCDLRECVQFLPDQIILKFILLGHLPIEYFYILAPDTFVTTLRLCKNDFEGNRMKLIVKGHKPRTLTAIVTAATPGETPHSRMRTEECGQAYLPLVYAFVILFVFVRGH